MAKMFIGGESVDSVTKNTTEVRNPATGAVINIPAKTTVKFSIGKSMKDSVA